MKLYVKEKLLSIHKKFYITNENDEEVYEISSKVISIGDKTTINDINNNEVAYIEQELFHLTPNYNVYINNNLEFKIAKKFQFLKNDYYLNNGYKVEGNLMMLDFIIYDEKDNKIGKITRKYLSIGDKYEIDIIDETKIVLILSIIVTIANDINRKQKD